MGWNTKGDTQFNCVATQDVTGYVLILCGKLRPIPILVYPDQWYLMKQKIHLFNSLGQDLQLTFAAMTLEEGSLLDFSIQILFDFFHGWKFSLLKFIAARALCSCVRDAAAGLFDQKVGAKLLHIFNYFNNYKHFIYDETSQECETALDTRHSIKFSLVFRLCLLVFWLFACLLSFFPCLSRHHSDQMSEQVSKVTLCVQILKCHWPTTTKGR